SELKYRYTVTVGGMSCKNCAARIGNAFDRQGIYAQADFKNGIAEIYSQSPVAEFGDLKKFLCGSYEQKK
ncbi:MAG: heavy-metal-associated domain-containing protein, partial [Oscillospiraceae bacterium]